MRLEKNKKEIMISKWKHRKPRKDEIDPFTSHCWLIFHFSHNFLCIYEMYAQNVITCRFTCLSRSVVALLSKSIVCFRVRSGFSRIFSIININTDIIASTLPVIRHTLSEVPRETKNLLDLININDSNNDKYILK